VEDEGVRPLKSKSWRVVGQTSILSRREDRTCRDQTQITSRHGPAGSPLLLHYHALPRTTRLLPSTPDSSYLAQIADSIADSIALFESQTIAASFTNTETTMQTAKEKDSNTRQLVHQDWAASSDIRHTSGKSERGGGEGSWLPRWHFLCQPEQTPYIRHARLTTTPILNCG
jgi:hypothetical protein